MLLSNPWRDDGANQVINSYYILKTILFSLFLRTRDGSLHSASSFNILLKVVSWVVRTEIQSTDVEEAKCKVYLAAVGLGAWQRSPGCLSVCHLSFQWGICCRLCFCPTVYKMLFLPGHWCGLVSLALLLLLHASLACLQVYFLFILRITLTIILTKCSLYPSLL